MGFALSLFKEPHLGVLNQLVHLKDGAAAIIHMSNWPHSEEDFGNNPKKGAKPENPNNLDFTLRGSIVRPVGGKLNRGPRRGLFLPPEYQEHC